MPLYEMTQDALLPLSPTSLGEQGFLERQDLQRLLKNHLEVLGLELLLIEEEHGNWEGSQRRIDLLAIDREANLVVIELKRDNRGGHMELQALRYAAMVAHLSFDEVAARLAVSEESTVEAAVEKMLEFLEWGSVDDGEFNPDVKIVLVTGDYSSEIPATVLWLNDRQLDIRCIRLQPHTIGERLILNIERLIPLPVAEDYVLKQKEKTRANRATRRAQKLPWTGYWFMNVGEDATEQRRWEDSMRYGFLGAGGRVGLRDRMMKLRVGDRLLAYVKGSGYVGEAVVEATATLIGDFVVKAEGKRLLDLPMEGAVWPDRINDDVNGEFCVAVKWTHAVAKEDAVCSHLAQRGTVCKMRIPEQVAEVREKLAEGGGGS